MAEQYPDLVKNLALGIFEMRIIVQPPGTVRTARKLRRMIDLRHFDGPSAPPAGPALLKNEGHAVHEPVV
jgi:hypothetical protein